MRWVNIAFKISWIMLFLVFLAFFAFLWFDNKEELNFYLFGEYPSEGEYWILFNEQDSGHAVDVYYIKNVYKDQKIDTSNLVVYSDLIDNTSYTIDKTLFYDAQKIREFLLTNGLATINDESIATEDELACQKWARENERGYWNVEDTNQAVSEGQDDNEINVIDLVNFLIGLTRNKISFMFKCILGAIGIGTVIQLIIIFLRRKKIDVILGGEISAGKTTVLKRLETPEIRESILRNITNTKATEIKKGDRIVVGKKDIYPLLIDNPGQQYAKIFDCINKKFFRNPYRMLIFIISLAPKNNVKVSSDSASRGYLISEIGKAVQMLSIVGESKTIKPIDRIIVFINKCDLVYSDESQMLDDDYKRIKSLLESVPDFALLDNTIKTNKKIQLIYGSALKGWGMYDIRNSIMKLS